MTDGRSVRPDSRQVVCSPEGLGARMRQPSGLPTDPQTRRKRGPHCVIESAHRAFNASFRTVVRSSYFKGTVGLGQHFVHAREVGRSA